MFSGKLNLSNEARIALFSFAFGLTIVFFAVFILSNIHNYIIDIFERNIGSFQFSLLYYYLSGAFWLFVIGTICLIMFYFSFKKEIKIKRKNSFLLLFLILMSYMLFLAGMFFIDNTIGVKTIKWNLQEVPNFPIGNVSCTVSNTDQTLIFVGNEVTCNFETSLNITDPILGVRIKFKNYSLGDPISARSYKNITFKAPEDVAHLSFIITGTDINNGGVSREATGSYTHTFLTLEEFEENRKTFLTYVLALIGLIAFTIPQLIIHLKDIVTG